MPLLSVFIALTEPGVIGRFLTGSIKMGGVSECRRAEIGDSLSALFCVDSSHGCGRSAESVPQKHW